MYITPLCMKAADAAEKIGSILDEYQKHKGRYLLYLTDPGADDASMRANVSQGDAAEIIHHLLDQLGDEVLLSVLMHRATSAPVITAKTGRRVF